MSTFNPNYYPAGTPMSDVIIDLLERIKTLENEIKTLKESKTPEEFNVVNGSSFILKI